MYEIYKLINRSYHELDEMYEAGIPPRKMAQYHTEIERSGKKKHL